MADTVEARIAERKAIAEEEMRHQNALGRISSSVGLATADGLDRVTPPATGEAWALLKGAAGGVVKGAVLGLIGGGLLAAFGILSPVSVAAGAIYVAMEIGAAAFGLYHGYEAMREYRTGDHRRLSDRIADISGAAPSKASRAEQIARSRAQEKEFFDERQDVHGPMHYAQQERHRREGHGHGGHHHER